MPDSQHNAFRRTQRFALALALPCLLVSCLYRQSIDPEFHDFGQYYMAAVIARAGAWDSLYPIPDPASNDNAGWAHASRMTPRYARLAAEHGVGDVNRFIQPPPMALLLAPLAWLSFEHAHLVWLMLMTLAAGGLGLTACHIYRLSDGQAPWVAFGLVFSVVCSPLMVRSIRTGQVSPLVALCLWAAVITLAKHEDIKTALAVSVGGLAKYVTFALLPVMLIAKRGKTLAGLAALSVLALGSTLAVIGSGPFEIFIRDLLPTFSRPNPWRGNQSISGFLMRVQGIEVFGFSEAAVIRAMAAAVLAWLVWIIYRRGMTDSVRWLLPASCTLVCWFVIFSPIAWEHYQLYLCPFWGWLIHGAEQSVRWRITIVAAIASSASSLALLPVIALPEPLLSHMLWSGIVFLTYSAYQLVRQDDAHPT